MKFVDRLMLIKSLWKIIDVKTSSVIECNGKHFQVSNWIAKLFNIYYSYALFGWIILFVFLLMPHIFENLLLQIIEALIVYIAFEYFLIFFLVIRKVN
jgi:hypothetical protein